MEQSQKINIDTFLHSDGWFLQVQLQNYSNAYIYDN